MESHGNMYVKNVAKKLILVNYVGYSYHIFVRNVNKLKRIVIEDQGMFVEYAGNLDQDVVVNRKEIKNERRQLGNLSEM